jgi:hypothetical protein
MVLGASVKGVIGLEEGVEDGGGVGLGKKPFASQACGWCLSAPPPLVHKFRRIRRILIDQRRLSRL